MRIHDIRGVSAADVANCRMVQFAHHEAARRLDTPPRWPAIPTSTQVCAELWKAGAKIPLDEIVRISHLAGLALRDTLCDPDEPTRRLPRIRF